MEAHEIKQKAKQYFDNLPLQLRNELNHDYTKFETWITDPENQDRAIKLGLKKPLPLKAENNEKPKNDNKAKSEGNSLET